MCVTCSHTVLVVCALQESMPMMRLLGVTVAMSGIAWYTQLLATQSAQAQGAMLVKTIPHPPAVKADDK